MSLRLMLWPNNLFHGYDAIHNWDMLAPLDLVLFDDPHSLSWPMNRVHRNLVVELLRMFDNYYFLKEKSKADTF